MIIPYSSKCFIFLISNGCHRVFVKFCQAIETHCLLVCGDCWVGHWVDSLHFKKWRQEKAKPETRHQELGRRLRQECQFQLQVGWLVPMEDLGLNKSTNIVYSFINWLKVGLYWQSSCSWKIQKFSSVFFPRSLAFQSYLSGPWGSQWAWYYKADLLRRLLCVTTHWSDLIPANCNAEGLVQWYFEWFRGIALHASLFGALLRNNSFLGWKAFFVSARLIPFHPNHFFVLPPAR